MKSNEDYAKLRKAKAITDSIKASLLSIVDMPEFPVYYQRWVDRLLKLEYFIIEIKYK